MAEASSGGIPQPEDELRFTEEKQGRPYGHDMDDSDNR